MLTLSKFTLMATLRCTLRCELCSENIPLNKPGEDLSLETAKQILSAFFSVVDHVKILHVSGGETFLHKNLSQIIEACMEYKTQFDQFMLFTNSTVQVSDSLLKTLEKHKDCTVVHASDYNVAPEITKNLLEKLNSSGINVRYLKYHGEDQDFGGWVDFGGFENRAKTPSELEEQFSACAITRVMKGNWRTRDGKIFWCTRAHRGHELGLIPSNDDDYVDILDTHTTRDEKRAKFMQIISTKYLAACNHCSGDCGASDDTKRHPAARQV